MYHPGLGPQGHMSKSHVAHDRQCTIVSGYLVQVPAPPPQHHHLIRPHPVPAGGSPKGNLPQGPSTVEQLGIRVISFGSRSKGGGGGRLGLGTGSQLRLPQVPQQAGPPAPAVTESILVFPCSFL